MIAPATSPANPVHPGAEHAQPPGQLATVAEPATSAGPSPGAGATADAGERARPHRHARHHRRRLAATAPSWTPGDDDRVPPRECHPAIPRPGTAIA